MSRRAPIILNMLDSNNIKHVGRWQTIMDLVLESANSVLWTSWVTFWPHFNILLMATFLLRFLIRQKGERGTVRCDEIDLISIYYLLLHSQSSSISIYYLRPHSFTNTTAGYSLTIFPDTSVGHSLIIFPYTAYGHILLRFLIGQKKEGGGGWHCAMRWELWAKSIKSIKLGCRLVLSRGTVKVASHCATNFS